MGADKRSTELFPNPIIDMLNIQPADLDILATTEVVNSSGIEVLKMESIGFSSIDISTFSAGLYLIRITQNGKTQTMKVLKN